MKSKGIVRKIDELGRIVIPKEYRNTLDVQNGDAVEISCEGDFVKVKKFSNACILCSAEDGLSEMFGKKLCQSCIDKIKREL